MTTLTATVNGHRTTSVVVRVPRCGVWYADVDFDSLLPDSALTGDAVLQIGDAEFVGTFASRTGSFQLQSKARIWGGKGLWQTALKAKDYHSDGAGVKALTVARDAALEAGETIGTFGLTSRLGVDFVRWAGPASAVLDQVRGSLDWWVDYAGVTQIGARAESEVTLPIEVLDYDPRWKTATISADDPRAVVIGSVIRSRVPVALTVRELEVTVSGGKLRIVATGEGTRNRVLDSIMAAARAAFPFWRYWAPRRYRVSRMSATRVELQIVNRSLGLPDILPISQWPGLAGTWAKLTPGAEVLVQFVDGDPGQPVVTHFAGKGGVGWAPVEVEIDASDKVAIGSAATETLLGAGLGRVLREGDTLTLTGVQAGGSATGVVATVTLGLGSPPAPSKVKA